MGESTSQKGGEAKTKHIQQHRPHRRSEERSQEAAEDRGRGTHPHQKGYKRALTEFKKGAKDHTMMNTSVRVHTALQQHRKHDVEVKNPHTGPKAFSAMRHNEEGKSMHNNHSKHRGKANQAVAGSNDTQRERPVKPGPRRQGGTSEGEGGSRQAGNSNHKPKGTEKGTNT